MYDLISTVQFDGEDGDLLLKRSWFVRVFGPFLLFSTLGFLVMGYHPGAEDDGVYLAAIKADLNPSLFPYGSDFFQLQMRTSVFPGWMAHLVSCSKLPVEWVELLGQIASMLLIVWACRLIACRLFEDEAARWGGVAMVTAMFTLPVAGTALNIADIHLHPRNASTALLLFAISRIQARRLWQAVPLVAVAFVLHPLMGALGVSFCCVLTLTLNDPLRSRLRSLQESLTPLEGQRAMPIVALIPFGWVTRPPSKTWLEAIHSRHWFRLYEWKWYEWLGAIAPIGIFWAVSRMARRRGEMALCRFATAIVIYSVFQQAFAMIVLGPQALIGFSAFEPMRYLHLVYVFLALVGGAYLARFVLKARVWRWAVFLLVANGSMFLVQRELFAASAHLELPWVRSTNPWLEAFAWIRQNTPKDAYFALDPKYLAAPGEDYHGFRALAERSAISDAIKDTSVVTKVPELGPVWHEQQAALAGWPRFKAEDFARLKRTFGVDWVLVGVQQTQGLRCEWRNGLLAVCRIP